MVITDELLKDTYDVELLDRVARMDIEELPYCEYPYSCIAENDATSEETLDYLMDTFGHSDYVQEQIVMHPNVSIKHLENASKSNKWDLQYAVVFNVKTPSYILKSIYRDNKNNNSLMHLLAKNPNTPLDVLYSLSDFDVYVQKGVAHNPSATLPLLQKLRAESDEIDVVLSQNPVCSQKMLHEIALKSFENSYICEQIIKNPSVGKKTVKLLSEHEDINVLKYVVRHELTPLYRLKELSSNTELLPSLLRSKRVSKKLLAQFAGSDIMEVKEAIVFNEKCDKRILSKVTEGVEYVDCFHLLRSYQFRH